MTGYRPMLEYRDVASVPGWVPDVFRFGIVGLVAPPGVGKFLTYETSVAFFTSLGIPLPDLMVPFVGAIELGAVVLLLVDRVRWVAAVALLPVMVVALVTAGDWQALAVLIGAVGLLAVDLGFLDVSGGESDSK